MKKIVKIVAIVVAVVLVAAFVAPMLLRGKAATEHAARIGAAKVMLTSNPAREAARGLYRKIGFEEAGTTVFVFKTDRK